MNKPTVSIIIPTYNRVKLLERAIESVLNQTYDNIIEIIVTDDGSMDNTKEVVEKYIKKDPRIIYALNTKYPHGPLGNRNNGLDMATGEFIAFCDDDDVLLPNAVSDLVDVYLKYGYKIILGDCLRSDNKQFAGTYHGSSREINYKNVLCGDFDGEYLMLFHKNLLGNKRFNPQSWSGESLVWWEMFKNTNGYYLHKETKIYNVELPERITSKLLADPGKYFITYKEILEKFGDDLLKLCPKRFVKYSLLAAYSVKLNGNYLLALRYWLYSFRTLKLFWLKVIAFFYFILPLPKKLQIFIRKKLDKILKLLFVK